MGTRLLFSLGYPETRTTLSTNYNIVSWRLQIINFQKHSHRHIPKKLSKRHVHLLSTCTDIGYIKFILLHSLAKLF